MLDNFHVQNKATDQLDGCLAKPNVMNCLESLVGRLDRSHVSAGVSLSKPGWSIKVTARTDMSCLTAVDAGGLVNDSAGEKIIGRKLYNIVPRKHD